MPPEARPSGHKSTLRHGVSLYDYLRLFVRGQRKKVLISCGVSFVLAITTGVSILLLIPMLQLCGVGSTETGNDSTSQILQQAFQLIGLSPTLYRVVCVFLLLSGIQAVLLYTKSLLDGQLIHNFSQRIRLQLYSALNRAKWESQTGVRMADLAHAMSGEVERVQKGTGGLLVFCNTLLLVSALTVVSIGIAPRMSLLAVAGCVVVWPFVLYPNRVTKRAAHRLTQKSRAFYRDVLDQLSGLKESRVLNAEQRHILNFNQLTEEIRDVGIEQQRALGITNFVFTLGAAISLCLMLLVGMELLQTPLVDMLVLIVIFARLIPRLRLAQTSYQHVLHALPALATVRRYQRRFESETEAVSDSESRLVLTDSIRLQGVAYRYPGAQVDALADVELEIPAGQITAIVGKSGSGKSTLADLLLGLLRPSAGTILIDNRELRPEVAGSWRNSIGYVSQDPFLLHDTIRANLHWSKPDATDSEIAEALRMAAVDQVIAKLPAGLDTIVGDRGVNLSGGERQRITLARALLRQPSVLILDEATSSVDGQNQSKIMASLSRLRGKATIVMIAHRTSTIREADQVIVLHNGRVAARNDVENSEQSPPVVSGAAMRRAS